MICPPRQRERGHTVDDRDTGHGPDGRALAAVLADLLVAPVQVAGEDEAVADAVARLAEVEVGLGHEPVHALRGGGLPPLRRAYWCYTQTVTLLWDHFGLEGRDDLPRADQRPGEPVRQPISGRVTPLRRWDTPAGAPSDGASRGSAPARRACGSCHRSATRRHACRRGLGARPRGSVPGRGHRFVALLTAAAAERFIRRSGDPPAVDERLHEITVRLAAIEQRLPRAVVGRGARPPPAAGASSCWGAGSHVTSTLSRRRRGPARRTAAARACSGRASSRR